MHPIENIMQTAMNEIKEMVDVNTIVGDAVITPDGSTIIPISKVSFGFVSGGGEYGTEKDNKDNQDSATSDESKPFAGGASAGISIQPVGFVIVKEDSINMLSMGNKDIYDKAFDAIPNVINGLKNMFNEKEENEQNQNQNTHQ
jgi:sporulation protein YtfJ